MGRSKPRAPLPSEQDTGTLPDPDNPGPRALHTHDGHRNERFSHSTSEQLLGSALLARSLNVKQFGCQTSVFKLSVIIPQKRVPTWRSRSPFGAFSDSAEIAGKKRLLTAGKLQRTGKGTGTEVCSSGMRQVELDPVQGQLHCRTEQQIRLLDADGCGRAPRKGFRKVQRKG